MIEIPEGAHIVHWCSLFCTGNEATGELNIEELPGVWTAIPICITCKEHIEKNTGKSLDTLLRGVVQ